jgi:hypothetical protein
VVRGKSLPRTLTLVARREDAILLEAKPAQWIVVDFLCLQVMVIRNLMLRFHGRLTRTGGNMGVRARGSTGCTTSSSSMLLPDVRFEFDRNRLTELPVCVRCILRFDEAMLPRCRTEACNC